MRVGFRHRRSQRSAQRRAQRRGLSILEVMISIGVATIGMLGALALLPLASTLAQLGLNEDAKSAIGRAAVDSFDVRGMRRADMLMWWDGTQFDNPSALWDAGADGFWGNSGDDDGDGTSDESDEAGWPGSDDFRVPVCIDPRLMSRAASAATVENFPFVTPLPTTPITMRRITLCDDPDNSPLAPMSQEHADQAFQTTDDLEIRPSEDTTEFPAQQFIENTGGDLIKRQFYGKSSWMAMLTPIAGAQSDLYNLSLIVFYERDVDETASPPIERVCNIDFADFHSSGVTGGDMRLTATTTDVNDRDTLADIDIHRNDWLLLAQDRTDQGIGKIFRWYRVLESDVEEGDSGTDTREVTLLGPDWLPDSDPLRATQAIFLPGVAAVYERVVRLENTNLWPVSNN